MQSATQSIFGHIYREPELEKKCIKTSLEPGSEAGSQSRVFLIRSQSRKPVKKGADLCSKIRVRTVTHWKVVCTELCNTIDLKGLSLISVMSNFDFLTPNGNLRCKSKKCIIFNLYYRPGSKKSKFDMTLISNSVFKQWNNCN